MANKDRIYVVKERLIQAPSLSRAKAFVAKEIDGRLASQADLVDLVKKGVVVEDADKKE